MTPEGYIKNAILSYLSYKGYRCFVHDSVGIWDPTKKIFRKRNSVHHRKGVSDIIGLTPTGRFIAIEVKAPKKYATVEQKEFIQWVKDGGGIAFVARSIEDVERELSLVVENEKREGVLR